MNSLVDVSAVQQVCPYDYKFLSARQESIQVPCNSFGLAWDFEGLPLHGTCLSQSFFLTELKNFMCSLSINVITIKSSKVVVNVKSIVCNIGGSCDLLICVHWVWQE